LVATASVLNQRPKPPRKIIPTFSNPQLQTLLNVIDTLTPEGYRDMAVILVLLDTGLGESLFVSDCTIQAIVQPSFPRQQP